MTKIKKVQKNRLNKNKDLSNKTHKQLEKENNGKLYLNKKSSIVPHKIHKKCFH